MSNVTITKENDKCVLHLSGRIDSSNAPQVEEEVTKIAKEEAVMIDLENLEYISSAGLRVILRLRKNHPELVRGQLSDAFLKEGEYVGVLYFILQNLLLNFVTKPDFVAYNHHYPEILSRKLCRGLYHNTAAAWTIKSQQELDEARKHFDIFIFDSFVPEVRK